jgi:diguanylate cyclase (GGDEF)-like protein
VFSSATATVAVLRHELTATLVELSGLARHDALTGLVNRREFDHRLTRELERCARSQETCTVLMCDLDRFKEVNDTHGHLAGDMVLKRVARDLLAGVRTVDTVARVGGEEIAVLLLDCHAADAQDVAERLRRAVALSREGEPAITISIGVADSSEASSLPELLAAADRALYEAKRAGRDRVGYSQLGPASPLLRPA